MSTQGVHSQPISRYPEKAVKTFAHVGSSSRQVHPSGQPKTDHNFAELESSRFNLLQYSKQPQQIFRFKSRYHHDPISVGCDYLQCLTRCPPLPSAQLRLPTVAASAARYFVLAADNFAEC